jgi:hypothetical protein
MKRSKKFFENEGIYCFFTFCTDWFSYFWIDWCRSRFESKGDSEDKPKVLFFYFVYVDDKFP